MDCPFCCEAISDSAVKCKHCGEFLDEPEPQSSGGKLAVILGVVFAVMTLCAVGAVVAAIAIPNLVPARKTGNETAAIGALKTISTAQALFREGDKDEDGNLDYGTLQELATSGSGGYGLIDSVLGSGTKQGYIFETTYSSATPEFLWMATARPALPGTTGDRYFATNHEGVIYYDTAGPIPLDTLDCTIPAGIRPVGR